MKIDISRTATASDAGAVAQLVNKAYRPEPGLAGWTHESGLVSGSRINAGQLIEIISKPDSVILVGLRESEIVACVHIEKRGDSAYIGMLAVDPALQGTGLGKQILSRAEDYAVTNFKSVKFIMVVLSARSELIEFYLRRGYHRTGTVRDYPMSADVGTPMRAGLTIETLEKLVELV